MDIERKKKLLLLARARQRSQAQAQLEEKPKDEVGGFLPFLNKNLARTVGAPVDLISSGLSKIGIDTPEGGAFGGSESIRRGMSNIGAPTPDREPQGATETIGSVFGEVAGMALPLASAAKKLQTAKGTVGAIASSMNAPMKSVPGAVGALGVESGAAVGAGYARNISKEQDLSAPAAMTAEVLGGFGGGFLSAPSILRAGKKVVQRKLSPFSEAGAFQKASIRAQEVVDNKQLAIQNIEDLKGSNLLPSAKSQDPGLMTLEKTIGVKDKALATKLNRRTSDVVNDLINTVRESGNVNSLKSFLIKKRERLKKSLDARVEIAAENAKASVSSINNVPSEANISVALRDELESALSDAKVQEGLLWAAVPMEALATTKSTFSKYKQISNQLSKAQSNDMPVEAKKLLGSVNEPVKVNSNLFDSSGNEVLIDDVLTNRISFGSKESVNELDGLYKRLGETARKARLASENNTARIAEELREAILEDMKKIEGSQEARDSVATARNFSREVNNKFKNGSIGKIMGTSKGAKPVPDELTLAAGVGGIKGKLAVEEISKALDVGIEDLGAVQDFIKRRFIDSSLDDGVVNPTKARNFIKQNEEILNIYPHLRNQFLSARSAEDALRVLTKQTDSFKTKFDQPSVSSIAKILKAPVDQEMSKVFSSPDPSKVMSVLVNSSMKDNTGEAIKGLRAGVSKYLIDSLSSKKVLDVKGRPEILGSQLKFTLNQDQIRKALSRVFKPKELRQWDKVADQLVIAQKRAQASGNPFDEIINNKSSWLLRNTARFVGAKLGGKLGSGSGDSLRSAAIGSQVAKDIIDRLSMDRSKQLLIDGLTTDPDLLIELLKPRTKASNEGVNVVLRNYMLNNGARLFEEDE
tara:strand:+ start:1117 stop:3726 length:2610 start_codon:yes stop_codon:yes gene_type:complete